jgi:hypothetical protein
MQWNPSEVKKIISQQTLFINNQILKIVRKPKVTLSNTISLMSAEILRQAGIWKSKIITEEFTARTPMLLVLHYGKYK